MPFDILSAWLVAVGSITLLVAFAEANRRSGWTRKRSDLVLDSLMLYAEMQHSEREIVTSVPAGVPSPVAAAPTVAENSPLASPVTVTSDLFALTRAIEPGISPARDSAPAAEETGSLTRL
jgi:hypothetical protein